jgi:hypothetical protein
MRKFFACLSAFFIAVCGWAQENKTIIINPAKGNENELLNNMYQYPQFVTGKAFYKDGGVVEAMFNYNYLTNEIMFIDPKKDTLALALGENFSRITIQNDTFYYHHKEFIQQITHDPSYNLMLKRSIKYSDVEKKGAYGMYSGTTANTSITQINTGSSMQNLSADQNIKYSFADSYLVSGRYNQFYPATKKGFYEMLPKNQKEIKSFLEKNEINFSKKEDLEKMLEFVRTLAK